MIGMLLDAMILMGLIKVINNDEIELTSGILFSIGTSVVTFIVMLGLIAAFGLAGIFIALILIPIGMTAAISFFFAVELKRAALIAVLFVVIHMAIEIGFRYLMSA